MDQATIIRERAAARTQHVAKEQPLYHLFTVPVSELEKVSQGRRKGE